MPKLPWVIVQLGCHAAREDEHSWNSIQEQQRRLPAVIERLDVAPAVDLELDDGIHIGGKSQSILGRRLARLIQQDVATPPRNEIERRVRGRRAKVSSVYLDPVFDYDITRSVVPRFRR